MIAETISVVMGLMLWLVGVCLVWRVVSDTFELY